MKKVILKSLTLTNFRGEKERTTVFNPDVTTISGANGLGKSRHFDAFVWLLFGKDTQDRKDFEIKTRVNGKELHKVECSVMGVFDVDGQELTLKRSLVEDWVKPRGQVEQVFKGHHTECWWNETPVKVSEFDSRVKEIVNSDVFKMITNPMYFANLDWKLQREQLFLLAGTISDAEIAAQKPEFAALLDKISGKSFADFKAELSAKKRRLKSDLEQIAPRIDQTHKMMPQAEDFDALEKALTIVDKEIADIDESISNVVAATRKSYQAEQARQARVNELESECQQLVFNAKTKAQDDAFAANTKRREIEASINDKQHRLGLTQRDIDNSQAELQRKQDELAKLQKEQEEMRNEWYTENEKEYQGETTCYHCGQTLPENMIANARELFNKAKQDRCDIITKKGKMWGEKIKGVEKTISKIEQDLRNYNDLSNTLNQEIQDLQNTLVILPIENAENVVPESIPEWVDKQKEITSIKATISTNNSSVDTSELQVQKQSLNAKRTDIVTRLAKRDTIAKHNQEIANLEASGKQLAQDIANIEGEEFTISEFIKTRIDECEKRVNAIFQYVSFRLFDYTIEGNLIETCTPMVQGVPYGSANTAGQVNAGLDIINTLCRYYGISAPIFIDNRESVNDIINTTSQVINLVVTLENTLTIK